MTVHDMQYCSTICVMASWLRQVVVGSIVTLFTGSPPKVWMSTLRIVLELVAEHCCETSATSVEALLPQVIWFVSQGAVGVVLVVAPGVVVVVGLVLESAFVWLTFGPVLLPEVVSP